MCIRLCIGMVCACSAQYAQLTILTSADIAGILRTKVAQFCHIAYTKIIAARSNLMPVLWPPCFHITCLH